MRNCFLFILICLNFSSCYSQTDLGLLNNWKSYPIPTNPDTLKKYNDSPNEWFVFIKDDTMRVTKYLLATKEHLLPFKLMPVEKDKGKMIGKISVLQVHDGYLVGFFRGEWGGYLYWFSKDGKDNYEISNDRIIQFIKRDSVNYAIEGLAHLGMSQGSIIKIEKENGKWAVKKYLTLPTAPEAIAKDSFKNFIVMTSKSLLKIDTNQKINILKDKGIWYYGTDPNSIIVKDNIVYAGMRAGIYKFNLQNGDEAWLLPY